MVDGNLKELLVEKMESFYVENNLNYELDESINRFKTGLTLNCKLKRTDMLVVCKDAGINFIFTIPIGTDDENEIQVMEFITRANYGLTNGGFQMNLDHNNIEYTMYIPCEDVVTNSMIDRTIRTGLTMLEYYGNELLAVMFGMKNAKDAFEEAERKMRG